MCAFAFKLDLAVVELWCITPRINYGMGKKLALGILLLCGSMLADPHLLMVHTVSTP